MRHIFYNILNQKKPYNTPGVKVQEKTAYKSLDIHLKRRLE